jgi:hypothetical protein
MGGNGSRGAWLLGGLAGCGLGIAGLWTSLWHVRDLLLAAPRYLATYAAAFALYLLAVILARRASAAGMERACLAVVLAGALAMRLAVWPVTPTLTTDFHRYLWDGRVAAHGINPYRYPPKHPTLESLRGPGWEQINFPGTRTPYPPFSQLCFWFVARFLGGSVAGLKLLLTLFELLVLLGLAQLLRARGDPLSRVVVYAWHPLAVTEVALSAHQDIIAIGLLFAGVALLERASDTREPAAKDRPRASPRNSLLRAPAGLRPAAAAGLALGLSVAAKGFTLLLLPRLARVRGPAVALFALAAVALAYLPYLNTPSIPQGGAVSMARYWESNGSLVPFLASVLRLVFPIAPHAASIAARVMAGALILAVSLWLGWRRAPNRERSAAGGSAADTLPRDLYLILLVLLLASPVVMPWYLLWLIPWLCLYPAASGLVFSLLVPLSYLLSTHRFPTWLHVAEYVLVYALLAYEMLIRFRRVPQPRDSGANAHRRCRHRAQ